MSPETEIGAGLWLASPPAEPMPVAEAFFDLWLATLAEARDAA